MVLMILGYILWNSIGETDKEKGSRYSLTAAFLLGWYSTTPTWEMIIWTQVLYGGHAMTSHKSQWLYALIFLLTPCFRGGVDILSGKMQIFI
jgi:hypothetical protein